MDNKSISYPLDDMSTTSQSLHSFLDDQWQQHSAIFLNRSASYYNLLTGVSSSFASVSGQANAMGDAVMNYHRQYEKIYSALSDLASQIDHAAQHMSAADQSVQQKFDR